MFANVVLVDEINRASPKTQSGLLECMQERRVTVDVHTHELARPFLVLATQNPIEYEGTYPLPEAQVDRFMVRISLGYPDRAAEAGMLAEHETGDQVLALRPVATAAEVLAAQDAAARVRAAAPLRDYIVRLLWRTREDPRVDLGASPRAGLMLLRAAKAHAMMAGRDHALPDDVQALAEPVLAHRLVLAPETPRAAARDVIVDAVAGDASALDERRAASWHRARRAVAVAVAGVGADPGRLRVRRRAAVRPRRRLVADRRGRPGLGVDSARAAPAPSAGCAPSGSSRSEPLEATIEVRRGRLGLPGRRGRSTRSPARGWTSPGRCRRCAAGATAQRAGRRPASPAAGCRRCRRPSLRRRATRSSWPASRPPAPAPAQKLLVLPRTEPVRWLRPTAGGGSISPTATRPSEALAAVDVDGLRPYRVGTPASRIHWPAVARGAGLIERRLQADGDARPLVVLDARTATGDAAELLDAAVRAAASLTLELARRGGCGLLLPGEQRATVDRPRADRLAGGLCPAGR